jgi:formate--tetrahydrofolate ligase
MEDINLHFNGDFHAVTTAHNLLAVARRPLFNGNPLRIDPFRMWPRTLDMNDRELRYTVVGLAARRTACRARSPSSLRRRR